MFSRAKIIILTLSPKLYVCKMTLSPKSVLPILSLSPTFKQKQKFPSSMTNFLLLSTLLERKPYRKPPKSQENHYLCLHKHSVTSMRKCPIGQYIETDSGHSINGLERSGTTHICKAMKYND